MVVIQLHLGTYIIINTETISQGCVSGKDYLENKES